MSIDSINSRYNLCINQPASRRPSSSNMTSADTADDTATISSEAIKQNLSKFSEDANGDGMISRSEIQAALSENLNTAQDILQSTIESLNIRQSGSFDIDIDSYNNVVVAGGTVEENSAIAEALQKNDKFRNAWSASSNHATLLALAGPTSEFQKAYRLNPEAALAKYSWLFGKEWDFTMHFENSLADYSII